MGCSITSLALGALVHRICRNQDDCAKLGQVAEALEVIEQPIINQCRGDRKEILNSLKAIGNSGIFHNEESMMYCLQRNDEIAVEAIHALRRTQCSDFRFSEELNAA